jgi:hypothetical protein
MLLMKVNMNDYFNKLKSRILLIVVFTLIIGTLGYFITGKESYTLNFNIASFYPTISDSTLTQFEKQDLLIKSENSPNLFTIDLLKKTNIQKEIFNKIGINYDAEDKSQGLILPLVSENINIIPIKITLANTQEVEKFEKNAFPVIKETVLNEWVKLRPQLFKIELLQVGNISKNTLNTPLQLRLLPAISAFIFAFSLALLIESKPKV